jgi:hypothetical protein
MLLYSGLGFSGAYVRMAFCNALGVDPFSHGKMNSCAFRCYAALFVIAELFGLVPYVGHLVKLAFENFFLASVTCTLIVEACQDMGIPESEFPTTYEEVQCVIGAYTFESKRKAQVTYPVVNMTNTQAEELERLIMKPNDLFLGWKLLRLFKIGPDTRVRVPWSYAFAKGCFKSCGFQFWYGNSRVMAKTTVEALRSSNVPYDRVKSSLENWNFYWAPVVRQLLTVSRRIRVTYGERRWGCCGPRKIIFTKAAAAATASTTAVSSPTASIQAPPSPDTNKPEGGEVV